MDKAYLEGCMVRTNPFEEESIKKARGLIVCSRSSCLTYMFCFLMVFLHVGQSHGRGDQPLTKLTLLREY